MREHTNFNQVDILSIPYTVPGMPGEDTNALTIKVGSLMGFRIDKSDISISNQLPHRVQNESYSSRLRPREGATSGTTNPANRFPKIIVKFCKAVN